MSGPVFELDPVHGVLRYRESRIVIESFGETVKDALVEAARIAIDVARRAGIDEGMKAAERVAAVSELRDRFASAALAGRAKLSVDVRPDDIARAAYKIADAMLVEREARP